MNEPQIVESSRKKLFLAMWIGALCLALVFAGRYFGWFIDEVPVQVAADADVILQKLAFDAAELKPIANDEVPRGVKVGFQITSSKEVFGSLILLNSGEEPVAFVNDIHVTVGEGAIVKQGADPVSVDVGEDTLETQVCFVFVADRRILLSVSPLDLFRNPKAQRACTSISPVE